MNEFGNDNPFGSNQYQSPQTPYVIEAPSKNKKGLKAGAVIAISLAVAIISSICTGSIFYFTTKNLVTSPDTQENVIEKVKTIYVDESTNNLISSIVEKVTPSVVGIRATSTVTSNGFFGGSYEQSGEGSGVVYSKDGYIITNYHVVSDSNGGVANKIEVYLPTDTDTSYSATVVGYDSTTDLAVIKIDAKNLVAIELGDSSKVVVGDTVVAIGNPGGLEFMGSASSGIISGLDRTIEIASSGSMKLLQTDAAINPGNSGGALVNSKGQLIGINSSKIVDEQFEGMGFSIPSNDVKQICDSLIKDGYIKRAYLGIVENTYYTASYLQRLGYPAGIVVNNVVSSGPAEKAGIKRGDIITAVNKTTVENSTELLAQIYSYKPNDKITLTVYRDKQYIDLSVTLGETSQLLN